MKLPVPPLDRFTDGPAIGLAVEEMKRHTTDEGYQIFAGLEHAGFRLAGHRLPYDETNVHRILNHFKPRTLVLQDKREWMWMTAHRKQDPQYRFKNVQCLKVRKDIFKVTILKDAQHNNNFHRESANEINCHAWIVYYNPDTVCQLAPFVRRKHLIRTWHTVDRDLVPAYQHHHRAGCLLSGAVSNAYPLRRKLSKLHLTLPEMDYLRHPGYHRNGSATPQYLQILSRYKVAICTSSVYGYALRKLIEATACGCVVLTDLPASDPLPIIDNNLVRVPQDITPQALSDLLRELYATYDPERQRHFAQEACKFYDYRAMGNRLALDIELLRRNYYVSANG